MVLRRTALTLTIGNGLVKSYLISKQQSMFVGINGDGLLARHLLSQQFATEIIENIILYGPLDRTCTELWIIPHIGQIIDGT